MRGEIWKFICKVQKTKMSFSSELYHKFLSIPHPETDGKIGRDIHRTAPDSTEFSEKAESGQNRLYNILKAYSQYDQEVSYVQGMNYIAVLILKYVPDE